MGLAETLGARAARQGRSACVDCGALVTVTVEALPLRELELLRELGLFRGRLVLLADENHREEVACLSGVETLTPEQLVRELQLGEKEFGTAGDGNPSGHRVGGGVSEL